MWPGKVVRVLGVVPRSQIRIVRPAAVASSSVPSGENTVPCCARLCRIYLHDADGEAQAVWAEPVTGESLLDGMFRE